MNRKVIKNLLGCIITMVITVVCVCYLGYIVRPTDTDGAFSQIDTFHNLPQNSLDVIVYGSSHAFRGFNVIELYDKYGIGGYNYGWHWQYSNTTKLFLEDSLLTQKPRIAIIETFALPFVVHDSEIIPQVYYTRYLNNKRDILNYLKVCFSGKMSGYVSYVMPLYAFHDNWNTLTERSFEKMKKNSNKMLYSMGVDTWDNDITPIEIPDQNSKEQLPFSGIAIKELDEIVSICKENNIDIIFYTAPYGEVYQYGNAMKDYANQKGYAYFNLFEDMEIVGIDETKDFNDLGHLNVSGATKVADYIGEYIKLNYSIEDKRNLDSNLWEGKTVEQVK